MYAVTCGGAVDLQFLSIDVSTAAATAIGTGGSINGASCADQSAWDVVNHTAYYATYSPNFTALYSASSPTEDSLVSVDLTTGVSTPIANFTFNGTPTQPDAIAIGRDGAAYALAGGELFSLDLATAELTDIAPVADANIYGFAVDPVSGAFFTIDDTGLIESIDVTTGALSTVGQTAFASGQHPYSLQIDSNGTMWVENDNYAGPMAAELWSVDRADVAGSAIQSGAIALDGSNLYSESLLIVPGAVAPVITSGSPAASIVAGSRFSFTLAASGTAPITFSLTAGVLPAGLTLDPATGVVSGTPTTAGSFSYTVTASNAGGTATADYTQVVTAAASTTTTIHLPIVSG
jgi:hypothetical protein